MTKIKQIEKEVFRHTRKVLDLTLEELGTYEQVIMTFDKINRQCDRFEKAIQKIIKGKTK